MTIYKVETKMINPLREYMDIYSDYEDAIGFYNGVKMNPDCASIEVLKMENANNCSLFEVVEIIASYS